MTIFHDHTNAYQGWNNKFVEEQKDQQKDQPTPSDTLPHVAEHPPNGDIIRRDTLQYSTKQ